MSRKSAMLHNNACTLANQIACLHAHKGLIIQSDTVIGKKVFQIP